MYKLPKIGAGSNLEAASPVRHTASSGDVRTTGTENNPGRRTGQVFVFKASHAH